MLEIYELYIACRRRIALGAPPDGILVSEEPRIVWRTLYPALPFSDEPVQMLQLRRDGASDALFRAFGQACADAGGGVSLAALPVRSPPAFEVEHDGQKASTLDWSGLLAKTQVYLNAAPRDADQSSETRS